MSAGSKQAKEDSRIKGKKAPLFKIGGVSRHPDGYNPNDYQGGYRTGLKIGYDDGYQKGYMENHV